MKIVSSSLLSFIFSTKKVVLFKESLKLLVLMRISNEETVESRTKALDLFKV